MPTSAGTVLLAQSDSTGSVRYRNDGELQIGIVEGGADAGFASCSTSRFARPSRSTEGMTGMTETCQALVVRYFSIFMWVGLAKERARNNFPMWTRLAGCNARREEES